MDSGALVDKRCLLQHFYERPSINTDWLGKQTRYAYLLDEEGSGGIMGSGVLKYDLLSEQAIASFDYGEYRGGEALFVPRDNAVEEEVHDVRANRVLSKRVLGRCRRNGSH